MGWLKYLPVVLDINKLPITIIGGGKVAARKVSLLKKFKTSAHTSPQIKVISPEFHHTIQKSKNVILVQRKANINDIKKTKLVCITTDDPKFNKRLAKYALKNKILVNVVDAPQLCNYFFPSVIKKRGVVIGISTEGSSPGMAKFLRKQLEKTLKLVPERFLTTIEKLRPQIRALLPKKKKMFWKKLLKKEFLSKIKSNPLLLKKYLKKFL